ncbi:MAG: hypothetical protein ACRDQU_03605 [Pseudonocardiaceae bacterium]
MISMPPLPDWLRVVWVVALGVVIVTHLWHAYCKLGQCRWWHAGHIVMAVGMVVMYLPGSMARAGLSRTGVALFGGAALATAGAAAVLRRREGAFNLLWAVVAVDLLIMAYMWLPAAIRPSPLDYALAGYLGCQLLAWSLGLWERDPVIARRPEPAAAAPMMARAGPGKLLAARPPAPTTIPPAAVGLVVHRDLAVRASLAVMVASMGYMLIVM